MLQGFAAINTCLSSGGVLTGMLFSFNLMYSMSIYILRFGRAIKKYAQLRQICCLPPISNLKDRLLRFLAIWQYSRLIIDIYFTA